MVDSLNLREAAKQIIGRSIGHDYLTITKVMRMLACHLRHSSFIALREDNNAGDVRRE